MVEQFSAVSHCATAQDCLTTTSTFSVLEAQNPSELFIFLKGPKPVRAAVQDGMDFWIH